MENIIINFIIIGEVWSGKSFLGNFLFGKELIDEFHGRRIQINSFNGLTIIETPGINSYIADDNKSTHEYLVENLRPVKNFRAILFVLYGGCYRLTIVMQNILKELSI